MTKIKDVIRHELIGIKTEIVESTNKSQEGLTGTIVDETKHTIKIQTKNGEKTIQKKNVTIQVKFEEKTIKIKGEMLEGRPEERIKTKVK